MPVHKDHEVKKYSENHILKNIYLQPKNIQSCMLDSKILKIVKNINQRLKAMVFICYCITYIIRAIIFSPAYVVPFFL